MGMAKVLEDIYGLHCYICTDLFSTDAVNPIAVVLPMCGHFVCEPCYERIRTRKGNRFVYMCGLCKHSYKSNGVVRVTELQNMMTSIMEWISKRNLACEKSSFHDFLKTFPGMSCKNCKDLFSTNVHGDHPPASNCCGHFICVKCHCAKLTKKADKTYTTNCSYCNVFLSNRTEKRISHGYMSLLLELHEKLLLLWSENWGSSSSEEDSLQNLQAELDKAKKEVSTFYEKKDSIERNKKNVNERIASVVFKVFDDAKKKLLEAESLLKQELDSENSKLLELDVEQKHIDEELAYQRNRVSELESEIGMLNEEIRKAAHNPKTRTNAVPKETEQNNPMVSPSDLNKKKNLPTEENASLSQGVVQAITLLKEIKENKVHNFNEDDLEKIIDILNQGLTVAKNV